MKRFGTIFVVVDGEEVRLNIDTELAIIDIDDDMSKVAAQMGFWGNLLSEAEGQKITADTLYRVWRASLGETILDANDKLAEWKVKQKIEAHPKFLSFKNSIAKASRNVVVLRAIFTSFETKASMLQSKGARARAELEATGMSTKRKSSDERKAMMDEMRKVNKKRKPIKKGEV